MIPRNIIQTSRNDRPKDYVVDLINKRSPGWSYKHYNDKEVIHFFKENPLPEFSNIIEKVLFFSLWRT